MLRRRLRMAFESPGCYAGNVAANVRSGNRPKDFGWEISGTWSRLGANGHMDGKLKLEHIIFFLQVTMSLSSANNRIHIPKR